MHTTLRFPSSSDAWEFLLLVGHAGARLSGATLTGSFSESEQELAWFGFRAISVDVAGPAALVPGGALTHRL